MKKIFTLSTGIVFLITILIAGGCKSAKDNKASDKVIIYLRSIEVKGKKHLLMFDTNDSIAIDNLITTVQPGTTVIWNLGRASRIKKIVKIYFSTAKSNIFIEDPEKRFFGKGYKLKIPDEAVRGTDEKYTIEYSLKDKSKVPPIDPFLRIPPID